MPKKGTGVGKFKEALNGRSYIRKTNRPYTPPPKFGALSRDDLGAFELFFTTRDYPAVAKKYGVTLPAVYKHAAKHEWIMRLTRRMEKVQEATDAKLAERLARDSARHYDLNSLVQVNAGNILRKPNLKIGEHVKPAHLAMTAGALETSIKTQRLIAGETTDKKELTVKDLFLSLAQEKKRREQQVIDVNSGGEEND